MSVKSVTNNLVIGTNLPDTQILSIISYKRNIIFPYSGPGTAEDSVFNDIIEDAQKHDNYEIITKEGHKPKSLKNISLCLNSKGYYECNQCEKQFKASKGLSKHFESIHVGVKYKCKKCEKEFAWRATMNQHIKTKHDGFRYICAYCDYKAPRLDNLKNHTKLKHSGQTADYLYDKISKNGSK